MKPIAERLLEILPSQYREWCIKSADVVPLDKVLRKVAGKAEGKHVYIITEMCTGGNKVLYVGQTKRSICVRFQQHMSTRTHIGCVFLDYIYAIGRGDDRACKLNLVVASIVGDLLDAEAEYINILKPTLNGQPLATAMTEEQRKFLEDAKKEKTLRTEQTLMENAARLDSIHARAYRDPNHPELRKNDNA